MVRLDMPDEADWICSKNTEDADNIITDRRGGGRWGAG
jgi:hypothetical protein